MKLLKGKRISEKILKTLKNRIKREKLKPTLAVFLVGEDKASEIYVNLKSKAAEHVGIKFLLLKFKKTEREAKIIQKIEELNKNKKISGIIVQLPLLKKFNTQKIINTIDPAKDVDGFHPKNLKYFLSGQPEICPVFPMAIMKFLKPSFGKKAVVIAHSKKFGEIMIAALKKKKVKATYILQKEANKNLVEIKRADIIISAVGQPGLIKGDMIKKGAIIIDGGITKVKKKVLGDVDFYSVKNTANYLTPVPGGVGPVTIACLLENVYLAAKKQSK